MYNKFPMKKTTKIMIITTCNVLDFDVFRNDCAFFWYRFIYGTVTNILF